MEQLEMLLAASLIALHAKAPTKPFRQRDVKFFTELFSNWIEYGGKFGATRTHNNQIARQLTRLGKEGLVRKQPRVEQPQYTLTSIGLVSCLRVIFSAQDYTGQKEIFFKVYFLSNYAERIRSLLRSAHNQIPTGIKLEIDPLLDCKQLITQAITQAQTDRKRLEARIKDALEMPNEIKRFMRTHSWKETVKHIEQLFPYELNATKSLSALCAALPEEIAFWELTEGSIKRATQLWQPLHRELLHYIAELKLIRDELQ